MPNNIPENLDNLLDQPAMLNQNEIPNEENTEEIHLTKEQIISMGSGIIKNAYAKVGMEEEGIAKAEIYETINEIVLSVIPFEDGLRNINAVEMKPQTALMIGAGSLVVSAIILAMPAIREGRKGNLKKKKEEVKDKEENNNMANVFVTGMTGTGKSYLIRYMLKRTELPITVVSMKEVDIDNVKNHTKFIKKFSY